MYPDKLLQCQMGSAKFFLWVSMSSQGCLLSLSLPLACIFGALFFPPNFGTKLVSLTFSLRSEEVLLELTSQKIVRIQV